MDTPSPAGGRARPYALRIGASLAALIVMLAGAPALPAPATAQTGFHEVTGGT